MLTTGFPRRSGDLFGAFLLELARALVAQGLEVEVVAPHEVGLARREVLDGVQVRRFRYLVPASWQRVAYGGGIPSNLESSWLARLQVPLFLAGFWWRSLSACRHGDLLHCHWTTSGLVGYWAGRWWRRPLVLSVRGSDIHRLGQGWLGRLNRWVYRRTDRIIAVSEDIAAKLSAAGVCRDRIRVVPNGLDSRFQPRPQAEMRALLGLPSKRLIAVYVGLLVPIKGLDVLVRALVAVVEPRLLCVLVGDGPMRSELEGRARELGLGDRLRFAGQRPSSEIPAWLNAADLLVLPSRSEGRPNVVLEAQGCGLPVVATAVGGTPELVRDGREGLLVPSDDPQALAAAMSRLLADDAGRRDMGVNARHRFLADGLTWQASAARVRAVYEELVPTG